MGAAISTFNDFVASTGPTYVTGPEDIVNEVVKRNYGLLRRFLRGKGLDATLRGGVDIRDIILLDEVSTAQWYQPNDTLAYQNPQVLSTYTANWRFCVDHMSWTDQQILLQAPSSMRAPERHQVYKKEKRKIEQRMWTSKVNFMEDACIAQPSSSQMETASGLKAYSLFCFVNEFVTTPFNGGTLYTFASGTGDTKPLDSVGASASQWSTVMGINPTTKDRWRNQVRSYSVATTTGDNVLAAMEQGLLLGRFDRPPTKEEYFTNPGLNAQMIVCSMKGYNHFQQLAREAQDLWVSPSRTDGAVQNPAFGGMGLEYVAAMDSTPLYPNHATIASATAFATEGQTTTNGLRGPRYGMLNGNFLTPVFHVDRYFEKHDVMRHPNQPFSWVCPVDTWWNLICSSRQRQVWICPANSTAFGAY
jgi:hypothetical protein